MRDLTEIILMYCLIHIEINNLDALVIKKQKNKIKTFYYIFPVHVFQYTIFVILTTLEALQNMSF